MLELELVEFSQALRAREISGLPFLFELDLFTESIAQSTLDQVDREIRDVDPDPLPVEFLRGVNGRTATAERIEHGIARIARGADDPLEKCLWFLRLVTEPLGRLCANWIDIRNNVDDRNACVFVKVPFKLGHTPFCRPVDEALPVERV